MRNCIYFLGSIVGILFLCLFISSWTSSARMKGYVVIEGKENNIKTQMVIPNTIYEIQQDIDLGKGTLTIPEGCTLRFSGGRLTNGEIIFNDTKIEAGNEGVFHNITARFVGNPVQNKVLIDWFTNSDNNDYENWANAVSIARSLVMNQNKEYHFKSNSRGYNTVRRDLNIEGNHATIILEPTYQLIGSDYCALIYHTKKLTAKNLNFIVLTSMAPREGGRPGRKSIDLFCGEDPNGEEGDSISAYLENINIYVKCADSGLGTLYNAKQGNKFVIRNCNLYTRETNTLPGGGSLVWFMFNKTEHAKILIDNCYAEANGQDECIAINPSGQITEDMEIDAIIRDCHFINKFNDGKGSNSAGLISMHPNTKDTFVRDGNTLRYNVVIDNCSFRATGAATNVARFYAANRTSMNVRCYDSEFVYEGESDFPISQMQNGMILLTKDLQPPTPCCFLFKNCLFNGKYIVSCRYQDWERGEVTFSRCRFICDSFVSTEMYSKHRAIQEATFKNCVFHFNTDTIKMGLGSPLFYGCDIYNPIDTILFPKVSKHSHPLMRRVKVNGKRIPSIN